MLAYCDECLGEYVPKLKIKKYKCGIEETYFKCPHCNDKYTAFYTDRKIRKQQKELRNFYKNQGSNLYMSGLNGQKKMLEAFNIKKQKLQRDMDKLKRKMQDG